jgi:hypothetical protein
VNERRNPTLCADNRFFSSFHAFSPRDDSVAQRLWGRLALNRDSAHDRTTSPPVAEDCCARIVGNTEVTQGE